jgi:hypothetical protein
VQLSYGLGALFTLHLSHLADALIQSDLQMESVLKSCSCQGIYLFRQSLAAGKLSPGPGSLLYCWLSLWPWPNTPETNNECFTKILKMSEVCLVGALQGGGPLGAGWGNPAILCATKNISTLLLSL